MKVLHGTWIPSSETSFIKTGAFSFWVETSSHNKRNTKTGTIHPGHLTQDELATFLAKQLGVAEKIILDKQIYRQYFLLPSFNNQPLPSLEMTRYLEEETPEEIDWQIWEIDCYQVSRNLQANNFKYQQHTPIIQLLNDLHFLALYNSSEFQFGSDLHFWYHYTQSFKQVILKDQYIPALKYRELLASKAKGKKKTPTFEIYATWEIISAAYEEKIRQYVDYMPLACVSGFATKQDAIEFYNRETILRHFSECLLTDLVTNTALTASFDKKISNSFLQNCVYPPQSQLTGINHFTLEEYQQWAAWKQKLIHEDAAAFYLCFQLQSASVDTPENWQLNFIVASKKDPSLKLELEKYWALNQKAKNSIHQQFGKEFEKDLLLNLGYAARMYPKIWEGLETDQPVALQITLAEAFEFLKESAWILEDAGYKVIVPSWWTPEGRQRAKIRLKTSPKKSSTKSKNQGYFSLDTIIQYQYELSLGEHLITKKEWQELVNAKIPLIQFRGQWVELDQEKMQKMLEFWQSQSQETSELTLMDLLKKATEAEDEIEIEHDDLLAEMIAKLQDKSRIEPIENPQQLQGTLREYQKRGVSWLQYLEKLGLNGCLADDMGLGKSIQVIAQLVNEKELNQKVTPTLLIAPTSVVGNWQKEIEKFAPHLQTLIHHGSSRLKEEQEFINICLQYDVIITSFTLVRKDEKLLKSIVWQRIVLDEAQNIKNPQAAQTKAILKLQALHRLALTGTPVENRLLDLWSILNFLNPGYLGKEAQFRKSFEIPIQKEHNLVKSTTLKKLVEPFILRRLKTDKQVIQDLPDKVEHKQYCHLTKEQASLYEAIVKDVEKQLEEAEGMQRKGLILSTLMKLKQVCNHPAQFLQDSSEFTPERSHKLERLGEMLEEVNAEGESLLIFTQFTEIGSNLEKYFKQALHYNTYYLHGGTNRNKREKMIAEFQDPESEPSVFILSLKAGGVGITLTKANHVFHFDRWWNPAVEDQATDRAFRIGQKKNVFVHKFVTLGTLEERIDQMIEDKKKLSSAIIGSDESWLTELDNESFKKLIALNKTAILD